MIEERKEEKADEKQKRPHPQHELDDRTLAEAFAKDGDLDALQKLLSKYQDVIYRFGLRMCGHKQDAEDVLQETFLAAYRYLKNFRWEASLKSWLLRLASSACLKKRRKRKGEPDSYVSIEENDPLAGSMEDKKEDPEQVVEYSELSRKLQEALLELPEQYRSVIILRSIEGLSTQETAEVVGISTGAVKVRLHRARAMLAKKLKEKLENG